MTARRKLTADDLLTRGYFHDRVIPPLSSIGLLPATAALKTIAKPNKDVRSRCTHHSVPKRKHLRRLLSIPNPFHQTALAVEIEKRWPDLDSRCKQSLISLSTPKLSTERALESSYSINAQPVHRSLRSVGSRYVLKTDIARFYPSIYTHSIAWAIHGKEKARANKGLYGNDLDKRISDTQDRQTGGIPIGPDTSFLIGEIIGSAIDLKLQNSTEIKGTRFIDDFYLYFENQAKAEQALALLHKIAKEFELEVNDPKTEIMQLPEELEPAWKTELRGMRLRPGGQPQATDLLSLFNRGFDLAHDYPNDNVLTYVVRQVSSSDIDPDNWQFCESLLMKAAIAEPTVLSVVLDILEKNAGSISDKTNLSDTVASLCIYHAPLEQGYEVAWALWLAKQQNLRIDPKVAKKVVAMDDDIVALVALDLRERGLFPPTPMPRWRKLMTAQHLYTEHWLLAYEAYEQGWLSGKRDYIAADPTFSILRKHSVRFYDSGKTLPPPSSTGYENENENETLELATVSSLILTEGSGTDD
jgi:hypothetical protein